MKRLKLGRRMLGAVALASLMTGCSVPSTLVPGPARDQTPTMRHAASAYLYVAQCCGLFNPGDVTVYGPGLHRVARRIKEKQLYPMSIGLDTSGTLYVLDESAGYGGGVTVSEFDGGGTKRSRRITGLYWGVTLALDSIDDLYVANCNTCVDSGERGQTGTPDSVTVYAPHSTSLLRTITQGVDVPNSMAIDAAGDLYVANLGPATTPRPSLTVYAAGSTSLLRKVTKGVDKPAALATDAAGDLYVANGSTEVDEYAPQLRKVLRRITDGIASPQALAIDGAGVLYVANSQSFPSAGFISVYEPGSTVAKYRIVQGIDQPEGLALDGNGDLYVADVDWGYPPPGWVSEYRPGARRPIGIVKMQRYGGPFYLSIGSH